MKRIKEKYTRTMKYWRIRYKQSSERERLALGVFTGLMLTYAWWVYLVL
jgi:hypothetical protein